MFKNTTRLCRRFFLHEINKNMQKKKKKPGVNCFVLSCSYMSNSKLCTGTILESKGMHAIFQKKGKKGGDVKKKAKYLKILAKMYKIENILKKGR